MSRSPTVEGPRMFLFVWAVPLMSQSPQIQVALLKPWACNGWMGKKLMMLMKILGVKHAVCLPCPVPCRTLPSHISLSLDLGSTTKRWARRHTNLPVAETAAAGGEHPLETRSASILQKFHLFHQTIWDQNEFGGTSH